MNKLLHNFKPPSGFDVEDYYGVFIMKRMKDNVWTIKLAYDYDSRSCNTKLSTGLNLNSLELVQEVHNELEKNCIDKSESVHMSIADLYPKNKRS